MRILSLSQVPSLKELLMPYGYTIHVHDACGGQAFGLEATVETPDDAVFQRLEEFFAANGMQLHYYGADKLNFVVK